MQKEKPKIYLMPDIKVVSFHVELGFDGSGFTQREEDTGQYTLIGEDDNETSVTRETWGTFN